MAKKNTKNNNLISLISLALIFLCSGVTFFILSFIDGFDSSLIMAACSTILGLIMLGYYMCLSNPQKK